MNIGIISDTHGCLTTWQKIYAEYLQDLDLIIHAGDVLYHGPRNDIPAEYNPKLLAQYLNQCPVPIVFACGNCDAEVDSMVLDLPIQSPYSMVVDGDFKILVTHGHHLSKEQQFSLAKKFKVQLIITGHTHIPGIDQQDGVISLNPGSPGMSKRADKRGTIAVLRNGKIDILFTDNGEVLESVAIYNKEDL